MKQSICKRFACIALAFMLLPFSAAPVRAANGTFNKQKFTPWDVSAASSSVGKRDTKPYTIMVYMNGSDLESEGGAATDDLIQMLDAGLDSRAAHVVLFTGGANRWQNSVVPANECVVWEMADGWLYELTGVGQVNMGDPGTLSSFIQFGMKNFPAERYGLIMWDHGGGSIAGYGYDEKFADGNLTLKDMQYAFEEAGLRQKKLEFLGFDSCLMASVEMAVVASDYARYLVASEDLEPGEGWNYNFLRVLNDHPQMDGKTLGVAIVDYFLAYYGADSDEILSLSVIDLSHASNVMHTMGRLMSLCTSSLLKDRTTSFRTLAGKRNRTKTFGEGSPMDNECDMVDVGDMAIKLSDLYPAESGAVLNALDTCVVYNRHNSETDLKGLSTYYIYGGKSVGMPALNTYADLDMDTDYTQYLFRFFDALTGKTSTRSGSRSTVNSADSGAADASDEIVKTEIAMWQPITGKTGDYRMIGCQACTEISGDTILWPRLNGYNVCLFPVNHSAQNTICAIPAQINGRDCDIIVLFNEKYPQGLIEGARNNEGIIIQKGYDPIKAGDRITLYYMEHHFGAGKEDIAVSGDLMQWRKSVSFTLREPLQFLEWSSARASSLFGTRITDLHNEVKYTKPTKTNALQPAA